MNGLLQLASNLSIQDRINFLQSSTYNKASDLFGFVPPPKKRLGRKNPLGNISINLVIKKNLLLRELESVEDPLKKVELLGLLESVTSRLRSLLNCEHKGKARWKRKQTNSLFNNNPCLPSKRVLHPRCPVKLSAVFDPFSSVPLPGWDGSPISPPFCRSLASENLSFSKFKKILNS